MTPIVLLTSDRPVPVQLTAFLQGQGLKWQESNQEQWQVKDQVILILLSPAFYHNRYLSTEMVWKRYLAVNAPNSILLTSGLQTAEGPNHLDLLALPEDWSAFMSTAQSAGKDYPLTLSGGLDTADKLRRFFAGHGNDSVSEVLARIRRTLRVAAGELQHSEATFAEIQTMLLAPAKLSQKWKEWQNRWEHYEPLMYGLPFSRQLRLTVSRLEELTPWMMNNCQDEQPLLSGQALDIIDGVKKELNDLESRYVQ